MLVESQVAGLTAHEVASAVKVEKLKMRYGLCVKNQPQTRRISLLYRETAKPQTATVDRKQNLLKPMTCFENPGVLKL